MTRIVIADDHPLVRSGLRALLDTLPEMEVIAEAANGGEVLELVAALKPDVVVMDIQMPGLDGVEATRQISASRPETAVLVLTMREDDEAVLAAMRAGARGYLLKGADQEEVARAIVAVSRGEAIFGVAVANRMLQFFSKSATGPQPFPDLTTREREILDLMASGMSNGEIAQRLFLSPKTISNTITVIFDKLEVADRAKAIVRARRAGLGHSDETTARC